MSKIVCDVCGTSYPETAAQCPICGCVRPADAQSVSNSKESGTIASGYTHVKGGRFSKSNVRKRARTVKNSNSTLSAKKEAPKGNKKDKHVGLVITAIVLILAIIAVVLYIAVRFFLPDFVPTIPPKDTQTGTSTSASTTTEPDAPCTELTLDVESITFTQDGESRMLYPAPVPADTTDGIIFVSSDESIATVSADGKVTAVAPGMATITVTCGAVSAECTVNCDFEVPTDDTSEATQESSGETTESTEETTQPADTGFKLNRKDITFSSKGESWIIYDGDLPLTEITWSTDDEAVATIKNGKVEAVGKGITEVHAEHNGEKVSCIIRCSFSSDNAGVSGNGGGVSEDGGGSGNGVSEDDGSSDGTYKLYTGYGDEASDISIKIDETFTLQLRNGSGDYVSVTWSVSDPAVCTVSDNSITGLAAGTVTVSATHDGVTYSCIVRVG